MSALFFGKKLLPIKNPLCITERDFCHINIDSKEKMNYNKVICDILYFEKRIRYGRQNDSF